MKIGINGSAVMLMSGSLEAIADHARQAAADGFASYWLNQSPTGGLDALTSIAVAAARAPEIEFGTAIVPTFPRHPSALAGQALTVNLAIGGRLTLGIGLSHRESIEGQLQIPFARPIRHMREYLSILQPLLREKKVSFRGEIFSCLAEFSSKSIPPPSVVIAALGPQMLRLAGRLADGAILWLVGPKTIATHIAPLITESAAAAGRPAPRIISSLPVCVTDDPKRVREAVSSILALYGQLPFYRAVLDREGAEGPADVAIIGNEGAVRDGLAAIADAGATDFAAVEFPSGPEETTRTRALLKTAAAKARKWNDPSLG
jgi:5,10-methylenetetrahydromethanopterin reductase